MKKVLLLLLAFICFNSYGQIQATTKDGKQVILNDDGTWEYVMKQISHTDPAEVNCDNLISTTTDRMTGESSTGSTKGLIVSKDNKKGFSFFFLKSERGAIIMSTTVAGGGSCIDNGATMNILFRDGSKIELKSDNKFNCKGDYTLYFGGVFGKKKELQELKTKDIDAIRVWTRSSFVEETFTIENSQMFKSTINCLVN